MIAFSENRCDPPGKLLSELKGEFTPQKSLRLLGRKRRDEALRHMVSALVRNRTCQNPGEIEHALKLITIDDIWEPVRLNLRLRTKKQAREYVQQYVTRRNRIVHHADTYKSKRHHDKLRAITKPYARECVRRIERFVTAIHRVVKRKIRL